jgi:hypothetical protein
MLRRSASRVRLLRSASRAALGFALVLSSAARAQVATPPMVGSWHGDARIIVNWTKQRTLPVRLVVHADDRVTGTVGDAQLADGVLVRYRADDTHTFRWKTEYLVDANLIGPVSRAENIWRTSVHLLLDWRNDHFEGGLSTSGWKLGSTERKVIDATLLLARPVATYSSPFNPFVP